MLYSTCPTRTWTIRSMGILAVAISLVVVGLAAPALAEPDRTTYPGEPGTIVERGGDGLVPSDRFRGFHRFDTARLIAGDTFTTAPQVLLARGDLFPDALAGSYLAGQLGAPLLLTGSDALPAETADSLEDLRTGRVIVLGGTAAISDEVVAELNERGYVVDRVGGADRFETARMLATHPAGAVGEREGEGATAIVARADEFPDALVAGSVSYASAFPLLLTTHETLHPDTAAALDELAIQHVIIPGGTRAVSDSVRDQIEARGITVERISGADRVATSVEFAYFARDELGFTLDRLNMARGDLFPDALTLGPHAGTAANPIVLTTNPTVLGGGGSVAELLAQTCEIFGLDVAGGFAAVDPDLEQEMRELATATGAICDVGFDAGDGGSEIQINPLGTDHDVTVTVMDNAGQPATDEAEVRFEVYRGDFGAENGTFALVESETAMTQDNQASFSYTGPDTEARDYIVACTTSAASGEPGQAPDTCTDPVTGEPAGTLVVVGAVPQNIGDDLAWSFQIKEWTDQPDGPRLLEARFCDGALVLLDTNLCAPHEHFGDDPIDLLQLTFDRPITDLVDVEGFEGSITITHDGGEVTFDSAGPLDPDVQFLTTQSFEQLAIDAPILELIDEVNEDQLLVLIALPGDPVITDALTEAVTGITGITGIDGSPATVPTPRDITELNLFLLDPL